MADSERRHNGGHHNNARKRRYRDDDDFDRRGPRRRFDAPPHVRIRKQLLAIAENAMRPWQEEVLTIGTLLTDNWDDELLRGNFVDLVLQLAAEQPLKTPFVAAVVLVANANNGELVPMLLKKLASGVEEKLGAGAWRDVKLYLKLLACLQGCLEGDGLFPILEELFARAAELQTASSEDTVGTELVKIILLTLPYIMSTAPAERWQQKAADLMDKTEIIAAEPHTLQVLVDPYHPDEGEESPIGSTSLIALLQRQLQAEANSGWELACLPRPWEFSVENIEQTSKMKEAPSHELPTITIPDSITSGPRALFPEIFFSVYADQDVESVPPTTVIASSLIRDAVVDTINILDYNRNGTARQLIELDCFFAPRTFAARATPFDRLRDIEPPKSTWKPEDVAVDGVFSQLLQLPTPEHKLVYFHSVLIESCKLAPAAIAPSLGRAIRYLYRNIYRLDLELAGRFVDWFSHHLSNFGFTWKWSEWVDDVYLADNNPQKAFIAGSIDKEIRLSFAQRIKGTIPPPYQPLISAEKERDVPEFKFAKDDTPFATEGRELAKLLRAKAPEDEIQPIIDKIHSAALDLSLDPMVSSTDVFVTAVLHVGSKSLSHVLAAIERTKDRLLSAGAASEAARTQIIAAVMAYWSAQPGVALCIVEKLLNYGIVSPQSVAQWALVAHAGATKGRSLSESYVFELVFNTVTKVTSRVHQVVRKAAQPEDTVHMDVDDGSGSSAANDPEATRDSEVRAMRELFRALDDALVSWASGTKDELVEDVGGNENAHAEQQKLVERWGKRWQRVFRRRAAIEESFVLEAAKNRAAGGPAPASEALGQA